MEAPQKRSRIHTIFSSNAMKPMVLYKWTIFTLHPTLHMYYGMRASQKRSKVHTAFSSTPMKPMVLYTWRAFTPHPT